MTTDYEARVQRTAAWLDAAEPGWVDTIDTDRLDMASWRWCVAGQIEAYHQPAERRGAYTRATYAGFSHRHDLRAAPDIQAGFNADHPDEAPELAQAWRRLIAERRFARGAIKPELLAV